MLDNDVFRKRATIRVLVIITVITQEVSMPESQYRCQNDLRNKTHKMTVLSLKSHQDLLQNDGLHAMLCIDHHSQTITDRCVFCVDPRHICHCNMSCEDNPININYDVSFREKD